MKYGKSDFTQVLENEPISTTGPGTVFQTAGYLWAKVEADGILVPSVYQSIFLSNAVVTLALVFYLKNYILVIMAFLSIIITEFSVAGTAILLGTKISPADCFALICPACLSSPYLIHMAYAYSSRPASLFTSRKKKLEYIYDTFGLPITTSTIMSLILTSLLFWSKYVPLYKFGVILAATKVFSLATSLLLFGSLAHIAGPENGFGDILCRVPRSPRRRNKVEPEMSQ